MHGMVSLRTNRAACTVAGAPRKAWRSKRPLAWSTRSLSTALVACTAMAAGGSMPHPPRTPSRQWDTSQVGSRATFSLRMSGPGTLDASGNCEAGTSPVSAPAAPAPAPAPAAAALASLCCARSFVPADLSSSSCARKRPAREPTAMGSSGLRPPSRGRSLASTGRPWCSLASQMALVLSSSANRALHPVGSSCSSARLAQKREPLRCASMYW
mmetsp:Transcript_9966/g.29409  ORF Transcript_9966/g.29409 Transcript_9966/m.29409 type:complete len:213 (-) Transcript_9966:75-713(-)